MGGCHGCSAVACILVSGNRAVGVHSGSEEIDALLSIAGKGSFLTIVIVSTYGDDVI